MSHQLSRDPQWIDPEFEDIRREIEYELAEIAEEEAIRRMEEVRESGRCSDV